MNRSQLEPPSTDSLLEECTHTGRRCRLLFWKATTGHAEALKKAAAAVLALPKPTGLTSTCRGKTERW